MKLTIDLFKTGFWISVITVLINVYIALFNPSYDFSFFVRFFTFFALILVGFMIWKNNTLVDFKLRKGILVVITGLAVLYNPIFAVHLGDSAIWFVFNVINAIGFGWFAYLLRMRSKL